jgi:hypothetical protein
MGMLTGTFNLFQPFLSESSQRLTFPPVSLFAQPSFLQRKVMPPLRVLAFVTSQRRLAAGLDIVLSLTPILRT